MTEAVVLRAKGVHIPELGRLFQARLAGKDRAPILCAVGIFDHGCRVEFMSKRCDAEIAHVVGVVLPDDGSTLTAIADEGADRCYEWTIASYDNPRVQAKVDAWEASGRPLDFTPFAEK